MDNRAYKIYQNRNTGSIFDSSGKELANATTPYIKFNEQIIIDYQAINSDTITDTYNGWDGVSIAAESTIKNNYKHYIIGQLATGLSAGAITEIEITVTDTEDTYINAKGTIRLVNETGDSESVDYTARELINGVYYFTVSATLEKSYDANNEADTAVTPIISASHIDYTYQSTGRLLFTMDGDSAKFLFDVGSKKQIYDCGLEIQVYDSTPIMIYAQEFDINLFNLRNYPGAIPPPANGSYFTKTEVNALLTAYLKNDFSLLDTKTTLVEADTLAANDSENSGNPIVVTLTKIWNLIKSKIQSEGFSNKITLTAGTSTPLALGAVADYPGFKVIGTLRTTNASSQVETMMLEFFVYNDGTTTATMDSPTTSRSVITGFDSDDNLTTSITDGIQSITFKMEGVSNDTTFAYTIIKNKESE